MTHRYERGLLVVVLMLAFAPGGLGQIPYPTELHVNAEFGDDTGAGTLSDPLASINEALQRTNDTNSPGLTVIDTIFVHASAVPVAPDSFGVAGSTLGKESFGWLENPSDPVRPPFPIRMQDSVSIIGVAVAGNKPRVVIDEVGMNAAYTDWFGGPFMPDDEPGTVSDFRCIFSGASNCTLKGFDIDGSLLLEPDNSWWPGVYVTAAVGFTIDDCDIFGWHDGICVAAAHGVTTRATVSECLVRDAWPFSNLASTPLIDETNFGHATMWVVGKGTMRVHAINTIFRQAHDGIELATQVTGSIGFTATNCRFEDTENGLEIVGGGSVTYSVNQCVFVNCHNKPPPFLGGTAYDIGSTGAIVERGDTTTTGTIRGCDFRNPAYGIVTSGEGPATDLGTSSSPGLNNFCIDFSLFDPGEDPYRVMLYNRKPNDVLAVGNWWLRGNQGAALSNGHLFGSASGTGLNEPPPGPLAGEFEPGGEPWLRNYSIANGVIEFGSFDPGTAPDCTIPPP